MAKGEKLAKSEEPFSLTGDRMKDVQIANQIMNDLGVPSVYEMLTDPDAGSRPVRMSEEQRQGYNLLMGVLLPGSTPKEFPKPKRAKKR